jgi:hypothetical protein
MEVLAGFGVSGRGVEEELEVGGMCGWKEKG